MDQILSKNYIEIQHESHFIDWNLLRVRLANADSTRSNGIQEELMEEKSEESSLL